jgi:hypothetical protein
VIGRFGLFLEESQRSLQALEISWGDSSDGRGSRYSGRPSWVRRLGGSFPRLPVGLFQLSALCSGRSALANRVASWPAYGFKVHGCEFEEAPEEGRNPHGRSPSRICHCGGDGSRCRTRGCYEGNMAIPSSLVGDTRATVVMVLCFQISRYAREICLS